MPYTVQDISYNVKGNVIHVSQETSILLDVSGTNDVLFLYRQLRLDAQILANALKSTVDIYHFSGRIIESISPKLSD